MEIDLTMYDDCLAGVIILHPTGIHWTNQTGGTACAHPSAEGFFVPLPFALSDAMGDALYDAWKADKDAVERYLKERGLSDVFEPSDDEKMYAEAGEAWVPVKVKEELDLTDWVDAFRWCSGKKGYITYVNSD